MGRQWTEHEITDAAANLARSGGTLDKPKFDPLAAQVAAELSSNPAQGQKIIGKAIAINRYDRALIGQFVPEMKVVQNGDKVAVTVDSGTLPADGNVPTDAEHFRLGIPGQPLGRAAESYKVAVNYVAACQAGASVEQLNKIIPPNPADTGNDKGRIATYETTQRAAMAEAVSLVDEVNGRSPKKVRAVPASGDTGFKEPQCN